jgi:hypothetical protein
MRLHVYLVITRRRILSSSRTYRETEVRLEPPSYHFGLPLENSKPEPLWLSNTTSDVTRRYRLPISSAKPYGETVKALSDGTCCDSLSSANASHEEERK